MKHLTSLLVASSIVSALALAGCRKEEGEKKTETTAATTQEKKAAKPPPPPVDEGIDVPTEEDFEDEVSAQITPESDLNKELDQLEKDIGKVDQQ